MIEKKKSVYYCEYCSKYYLHQGYARIHEKWCKKNPKNDVACFRFCDHLGISKGREEGEFRYATHYRCAIKKVNMHSPLIDKIPDKEYVRDVKDSTEAMPFECEHFESKRLVACEDADFIF